MVLQKRAAAGLEKPRVACDRDPERERGHAECGRRVEPANRDGNASGAHDAHAPPKRDRIEEPHLLERHGGKPERLDDVVLQGHEGAALFMVLNRIEPAGALTGVVRARAVLHHDGDALGLLRLKRRDEVAPRGDERLEGARVGRDDFDGKRARGIAQERDFGAAKRGVGKREAHFGRAFFGRTHENARYERLEVPVGKARRRRLRALGAGPAAGMKASAGRARTSRR